MRAAAVPISTYSCNVLADACIRCGQPQRALKLYRDFEAGTDRDDFPKDDPARQLDLRSFNIMLKAHREMGQLEGALGTLAALKVRLRCALVGGWWVGWWRGAPSTGRRPNHASALYIYMYSTTPTPNTNTQ